MLKHNHQYGALWITGFSWPVDEASDPERQAEWLEEAYTMMSTQLYIEVTFFDALNAGVSSNSALISTDGRAHPALELFKHRNEKISSTTQLKTNLTSMPALEPSKTPGFS